METKIELNEDTVRRIIHDHIRAAVTHALTNDGETFIRAFVDQCLTAPESGWNRGSKFEEAFKKAMKDQVDAEIRTFLDERRQDIAKLVRAECERRGHDLFEAFASSVVDAIKRCSIQMSLNVQA